MEDNKGLAYFFLGLGVGVAVGMIFAPVAGSEARGAIRSKALEGGDYLRRRSEEFRDSAGDVVQRGKEIVNRQKDQLSAAVDAGRQAYREAISSAGPSGVPAGGPQGAGGGEAM
jgi:gas vesicle protein